MAGVNVLSLTSKACTPSQPPWDPSSARSHRPPWPLRTPEAPTYSRMRHRRSWCVSSKRNGGVLHGGGFGLQMGETNAAASGRGEGATSQLNVRQASVNVPQEGLSSSLGAQVWSCLPLRGLHHTSLGTRRLHEGGLPCASACKARPFHRCRQRSLRLRVDWRPSLPGEHPNTRGGTAPHRGSQLPLQPGSRRSRSSQPPHTSWSY